ncbi:MAG: hypothetical protein NC311_14540 [Muribaculaceae bacterium]|nr:hypothetical protein [Muribaculaceae bacterium]
MKKTILLVAVAILSLGYMKAETPDNQCEKCDTTSRVAKFKKGVVNVYEKVKDGTVEAADTVGSFSARTYKSAKKGTVKAAGNVADFSEKTYDKAKKGTVKDAKKVADFSEKTYDKAKDGTVKTAKKVG